MTYTHNIQQTYIHKYSRHTYIADIYIAGIHTCIALDIQACEADKNTYKACSKCRTLNTSTQTVSVQVQPVNYQRHYHWAQSL